MHRKFVLKCSVWHFLLIMKMKTTWISINTYISYIYVIDLHKSVKIIEQELHECMHVKLLHLYPILHDTMDCKPSRLLCPWDQTYISFFPCKKKKKIYIYIYINTGLFKSCSRTHILLGYQYYSTEYTKLHSKSIKIMHGTNKF